MTVTEFRRGGDVGDTRKRRRGNIIALQLGSRIVSKNPRTEDYDYGYEEPDALTWSRIVIETYRNNGLRVQIEKLVPNKSYPTTSSLLVLWYR